MSTTSTPAKATDDISTSVGPAPIVGLTATDYIGFYGNTPIALQSVTASGVTAAQILTALNALGLLKSV